MTLYLFTIPGCEACTWVKDQLDAFEAVHPEIDVQRIDMTMVEWDSFATGIAAPTEFPSYAVQRSNGEVRTLHGRILSKEMLEKWVRGF